MINELNQSQSYKFLESNYIGNLAYIAQNIPYIVPITYYYDKPNNDIIGYSTEGHKIKAMRKSNNVCLGVTSIDSINSWKSIVVHGSFTELSSSMAKAKLHIFSLGVKDLVINKEQRKLDFISDFSSKTQNDEIPIVFVIKAEIITGRIRHS